MIKRMCSIWLALAVALQGGALPINAFELSPISEVPLLEPEPIWEGAYEPATEVTTDFEDALVEAYEETTYYEEDIETTTEQPPLTLSSYYVYTCEEVVANAYYPGADGLRLYDGRDDRTLGETDEDEAEWSFSVSESGEHGIWLAALLDGECEDIAVEYLEVDAPYGDVSAPVFNTPFAFNSNNGNLTISWSDDYDDAYKYTLTMYKNYEPWWEASGTSKSFTVPKTATVNSNLHSKGDLILEPGIVYESELHMEVPGYESGSFDFQVFIPESDNDISLTFDGNTDNTSVMINQAHYVEVTAPEEATAILFYNGVYWGFYEGNTLEYDDIQFYADGQKILVAKYTTDDVSYYEGDPEDYFDWVGSSNIIYVDVYSEGTAPEPEVTLDYQTITRGDYFFFSVHNSDEIGGFEWAVLDGNNEVLEGWHDWEGDPDIAAVSMWRMEKSGWVTLYVNAYGSEGYYGSQVEIPFYVRMTKSEDPEIGDIPSSVSQGETIIISIEDTSLGEDFYAWIWEAEGGTHTFYHWDGVDTIYLPTYDIPVGECDLYVEHSGKAGYGVGSIQIPLEITEAVEDTYLTVSNYTPLTNDELVITAFAPGAEQIDIVVYNEDDEDWELYSDYSYNDSFQTWLGTGNTPGNFYVSMEAHYPDRESQVMGIPITIEAPYGPLQDPRFDGPAYIYEGEYAYPSVFVDENAGWFNVNVVDVEDATEICSEYFEGETAWYGEFEPVGGHTYEMNVYEGGGKGYTDVAATRSIYCLNDDEMRFEAECSSAKVGESFDILCLVPGAEAVEIEGGGISISTDDGWDWRDCSFTVTCEEVGTVEFRYRVKINGRWTGWFDPIEVEIYADGYLEDPELFNVPEYIMVGDTLYFDLSFNELVRETRLWIEDVETGDSIYEAYYPDVNMAVDGEYFNPFKTYRIHVEAMRRGYVKGEAIAEFFVTSYDYTDLSLSIGDRYAIDEGNYMMGYIDLDCESFCLELWHDGDTWTENWWTGNTFAWSTMEEGDWSLRAAVIDENGYQISPWSDWVDFVAFDAEDLDTVSLPEDLREIKEEALMGIAAERIVIPYGVTYIGEDSFDGCDNLQVVEFKGDEDIEIYSDFDGVYIAPLESPAWEWCINHGGCMAKN